MSPHPGRPHAGGQRASAGAAEEARPVREEDAVDVEAVHAWLREHALEAAGIAALDEPPQVRQFSGGASNLTYLLHYPGGGHASRGGHPGDDARLGSRDLILRRPPAGVKAASAHDMAREFRIQRALAPVFPYVPKMIALCQDHSVIGGDFYVMERVEGTILRSRIPPELGLDERGARSLCESAVERLVELHSIDPAAAGLADISKGPGYVRRQVQGWSDRYRAARTWNVPRFERVMHWLEERQPPDMGQRVIHNDFRLDNLVLAPGGPRADDVPAGGSGAPHERRTSGAPHERRTSPAGEAAGLQIVGVLDWEMATVGDPLMDLGGALAYWVQADDDRFMRAALRRQPTDVPGMLTRREMVDLYAQLTGTSIDARDWVFYEVFGLFRLATIIQQIYRRYHLRQTRNPAFRHYWLAVRYLNRRCKRIIRRAP